MGHIVSSLCPCVYPGPWIMFSGGLLMTGTQEKAKEAKMQTNLSWKKKKKIAKSLEKLQLASMKTADENRCKTNN